MKPRNIGIIILIIIIIILIPSILYFIERFSPPTGPRTFYSKTATILDPIDGFKGENWSQASKYRIEDPTRIGNYLYFMNNNTHLSIFLDLCSADTYTPSSHIGIAFDILNKGGFIFESYSFVAVIYNLTSGGMEEYKYPHTLVYSIAWIFGTSENANYPHLQFEFLFNLSSMGIIEVFSSTIGIFIGGREIKTVNADFYNNLRLSHVIKPFNLMEEFGPSYYLIELTSFLSLGIGCTITAINTYYHTTKRVYYNKKLYTVMGIGLILIGLLMIILFVFPAYLNGVLDNLMRFVNPDAFV